MKPDFYQMMGGIFLLLSWVPYAIGKYFDHMGNALRNKGVDYIHAYYKTDKKSVVINIPSKPCERHA